MVGRLRWRRGHRDPAAHGHRRSPRAGRLARRAGHRHARRPDRHAARPGRRGRRGSLRRPCDRCGSGNADRGCAGLRADRPLGDGSGPGTRRRRHHADPPGRLRNAPSGPMDDRPRALDDRRHGPHLGLSKIHGRFHSFSGELVITDPPERSGCEATIDAASIDTGNEQRDAHLRSADFLDVDRYPTIGYRGTAVEPAGPGRWTVHGALDLAGTTREVPLELRYGGTRPDPWGGVRAGFTAAARLNREDFRMNWNQAVELGLSLVGAHLLVELDIQAVLAE